YTTKGARGTGLGLATVFGAMERHQGKVEIESELNRGTVIRLIFPADVAGIIGPTNGGTVE
ncbi:MAG: HAMP domain-containing histidine kinase, partial [Spirochaetaceae bacterium]|nr:HAMP domain-containing histidine kinase [Spirochaetaceae bacterium]